MRTSRTAAAAAGLALAAVSLVGCSSAGSPAGNASSFGNVSGSAVPVSEELTALCKQIVTQALTVDAATALAESGGYTSRVGSIDGEAQALTMDVQEDRMTFEVENDVVVGCTVG